MKITMQWKDPDAPVIDIEGDILNKDEVLRTGDSYHLPDDIQDKLRAIGCAEYLVVEFDLDTMTGRVVNSE